MDLLVNLLFFGHLIGLVLGIGSGIALAAIPRLATSEGGAAGDALLRYGDMLRVNSNIGLALLWITGPLMIWLRYGGFAGLSHWFWVKMLAVVVLSAAVGMGSASYKRMRAGQGDALNRFQGLSALAGITSIIAVAAAVMTFN